MSGKELWLKQISIKKNQNYIEKLLHKCKMNNYNFTYNGYGDYDLLLNYNNNEYKISIDDFEMCLKVFKKNQTRNKKNKEFYHLVKCIYGLDAWYECLKLIKK